jgi:hypothetical protein
VVPKFIPVELTAFFPCRKIILVNLMYENDERHQFGATVLIYHHKYLYMFRANLKYLCMFRAIMLNTTCSSIQPVLLKMGI